MNKLKEKQQNFIKNLRRWYALSTPATIYLFLGPSLIILGFILPVTFFMGIVLTSIGIIDLLSIHRGFTLGVLSEDIRNYEEERGVEIEKTPIMEAILEMNQELRDKYDS